MKVRYIRDSQQGSSDTSYPFGVQWLEIKAIDINGVNVALGKNVTHSFTKPGNGEAKLVTDGEVDDNKRLGYANDENKLQYVIIDLGKEHEIIQIQKYHRPDGRIYKNVKVEISTNGTNWETVFSTQADGEYPSTELGKMVNLNLSPDVGLSTTIKSLDLHYNELEANKYRLKNNLISKGVEVSETDKMSNLIDKVDTITSTEVVNVSLRIGSTIGATIQYTDGNQELNRIYSGADSLYTDIQVLKNSIMYINFRGGVRENWTPTDSRDRLAISVYKIFKDCTINLIEAI